MLKTISILALLSSTALASSGLDPVVGGTAVPKGAWPDAVAVLAEDAACTGTLIAPDVVLTAGHCIEVSPFEVIVATTDFGRPGGEVIRVKSATAYPDWAHKYDVGVLVLEHPAMTKPRPIASPCTAKGLVANAQVRVVGFGLTTASGTGDNTRLHEAVLSVADPTCTSDASCARAVAPNGEFTADGGGKRDACYGDSGGPIYLGDALIGVVSRGLALPGKPCGNGGVYVRADTVAGWIERVTKRKLVRATCGKDDDDAPDDGSGGCAAAGGAGLPLVVLWFGVWRRRRARRAT